VSDLTGEIIDNRYQLQRIIASGGMATIYSALDLRLDRTVAVKIMHSHLANDEDFVNRFIREAKAAAALSHPNIVAIQDQGWNEGGAPAVFIVMELIDGFTLRDLIHEQGQLKIEDALRYFAPILSALSAAHRKGILHRDIKPENILISKDGRVKIADFGLARAMDMGATMTAESSVILGSVSYLSPEQVQRGISDARSDVYAAGIVLFEMLTGKKPYDGESPIQIAYMHVNENVPAPSTLRSEIPQELDSLVVKATANNPDKRYSNAGAMQEDFQAILQKLDPKRRQLSLELDIPIQRAKPEKKRRDRFEIKIGASEAINTLKGAALNATGELRRRSEPVKEKTGSTTTAEIRRKRKTSNRVKRNRAIALLILFALLFTGYKVVGGGNKIAIPSLAGMTQAQATKVLSNLGLKADISDVVFSEDVPIDKVILSRPAGGGKVSVNGTVHLQISKGPDRIVVPALAGLTVDSATALLEAAGLKVGRISKGFSATREMDLIVSSSPSFKSQARKGSTVDLVISQGIEQVSVSSYVGKTSDQALNEITSAGLIVNSIYEYSDTVPLGTVISQNPDGSSPLARGSKLTLTISKGPAAIFIPNVYSLTEIKATTILENLGFQVKVKKIGTKKVKTVTNISPASGTKAKPGSLVTITLG